jgi:D-aspartate ligase
MSLPGAIVIEGHVQGLSNTRALGEAGIPVYVVDKHDCIAHYSRYCKKFFICPDFDDDTFAEFLIKLCREEMISGWLLLPSNDHAVFTLSKHKNSLQEFYKIITPSKDIILNIYDKLNLFSVAINTGVSCPSTITAAMFENNREEPLKYPVIIKGRQGLTFYKTTGKKAFLSVDEAVLKSNLKRLSKMFNPENILIQEVIRGAEGKGTISFTAFCENGNIRTYWIGRKIREHPPEFGTATFCESISCVELAELSSRLVRELNYTGVCEIEFIKDYRDDSYKLIEINARTWLWTGLAKACGIDYARMIYNYVNGYEMNYPLVYDDNIKWSNRLTDSVYSFMGILKGKVNLVSFFKSYKGRIVHAHFDRYDRKPSLYYFLFLFRFLKNR